MACSSDYGALLLLLAGCHGRGAEAATERLSTPATSQAPAASASSTPLASTRSFRLTASGGIGFDDLVFSRELKAVLAPAGGTGCVEVFDSASRAKSSVCGLSATGEYAGGHGEGTTSADAGGGFVFAIDRSSRSLKAVDAATHRLVLSSKLAGAPDYVRWVATRRELWVTEPDQEQIEIFSLSSAAPATLTRVAAIAVKGGPESLVIDTAHGTAFTHLWAGRSVSIDIASRTVGQSFANGCRASRGIALDSVKRWLFTGCAEGKAVVLDLAHGGTLLSELSVPSGVDIIAVNLELGHLYVPSSSDGSVSVLGVAGQGKLVRLGALSAARGTHCVASDDQNRVWVCAPEQGALLLFDDPFPAKW